MTGEIIKKEETNLEGFKKGVDDLLTKRDYFIKQVLPKLQEKQDYYVIMNKKSLAKGGAEKLASIYNYVATFKKDTETVEMLSDVKGMVAYVCDLSKNGEIVGQGRGADTLLRNGNDPNKTIKMAQKRAYVDAVIRATGLSDIFTQDLEDMENGNGNGNKPAYQKQNKPFKKPNSLGLLRVMIEKEAKKKKIFGKLTEAQTLEIINNKSGLNIKNLKELTEETAKTIISSWME